MRILVVAAVAALFLAGPALAGQTCRTFYSNGLVCTECCADDGTCATVCSTPPPPVEPPVEETPPLTPCTTCPAPVPDEDE